MTPLFFKKILPAVIAITLAVPAFADDDQERGTFELEGGVGMLDIQKPAAVAIVQMRLNSLRSVGGEGNETVVGPKIDVQIGFGTDGVLPIVPHADIAATLVRVRTDGGSHQHDKTMFGYEGLTVNYQREVAIDLNHTVTVSLAGAWLDSRIPISPGIKMMVRALLDIASVGYVQRLGAKAGEVDNVFGWTPNFDGEFGIEFLDRFRIVLGERAIFALGASTGSAFNADNQKGTANGVVSRSSVTASFDLTKNITTFAEGSYALYAFNARPDASTPSLFNPSFQGPDSHNEKGVWQMIFGFGGKF